MLIYVYILDLSYSSTDGHVKKDKTMFNTIKIMLDLYNGFRSHKTVRTLKVCVNALVKQYQLLWR